MSLLAIDHVGIAVVDLEKAIDFYKSSLSAPLVHREVVASDGVEEALLRAGESYIQLLTPTSPDSPVAAFLEKRGEGLHHIAYRVEDCARALVQMTSSGAQAIDKQPRAGSRHTLVAFVHPRSAHGTLIELVQELAASGETP